MVKQIHIFYSAIKKGWTTDTFNNLDEFPENYAEWREKKKKPKDDKLYINDPMYVTFLKI